MGKARTANYKNQEMVVSIMIHEAGKGDAPRPTDMDEFRKNWERIFGKPPVSEHPREADNAHPMDEKH